MSRHAADMAQYGISNEWANQVDKATPEVLRMLEISIFLQRLAPPAPAARLPRSWAASMRSSPITPRPARRLLTIAALEGMIVAATSMVETRMLWLFTPAPEIDHRPVSQLRNT